MARSVDVVIHVMCPIAHFIHSEWLLEERIALR